MTNNQLTPSVCLKKFETGCFMLSGQLVFKTVATLFGQSSALFDPSNNGNQILINCADVSHMDSAGIALLLEWKREAVLRSKTIEFKKLPQQAQAIIHAARLDEILYSTSTDLLGNCPVE